MARVVPPGGTLKRKPTHASSDQRPVSKRFCADDADIVLRSTVRPADDDRGLEELPATLFRVNSEDLKRMSVVFRDMLVLGESRNDNDDIELSEDAWQLEQLLSLNSADIDQHPDLFNHNVADLLRLHKPAVKYAMVGIQTLTELAMRNKLPNAMAGEAAQVYSHAKRHSRFALAEAAEKRLLLLPVENWGVDVSESSDSFEAPLLKKLDQIDHDLYSIISNELESCKKIGFASSSLYAIREAARALYHGLTDVTVLPMPSSIKSCLCLRSELISCDGKQPGYAAVHIVAQVPQ